MYATFLKHQWMQFWRSRNTAIGIVGKILLGILILYFLILSVAIGFFMEKLISELFPGKNNIVIFNDILPFYFMVDFLLRLQLQELPTLSVIPYLHLNIRKNSLVNFLNLKSLFSVFNFLPLFIFLPFCLTVIEKTDGVPVSIAYIISIVSIALFMNFLVLYVKRKSSTNLWLSITGIALTALLGLLEYYKIISLTSVSNIIFGKLLFFPFLSGGFVLLAVFAFLFNSHFLRSNLYIEELRKTSSPMGATDFPFLNRFGKVGELAALEIKLISRNKRPRTLFPVSLIFLLYGLLIYKPENLAKNQFSLALMVAIFITGGYIYSYGQLMFSWQSAHFDGLISSKMDYRHFIKAKFLLFTIYSTVVTIIALLYGFISWKIIPLEIAAYLFTIGFGTVLMLYFAMFKYKPIDIDRGSLFNHEGSSAIQFLAIIPIFLIPFAIFEAFNFFQHPFLGMGALGLFGLISFLLRSFWINFLTKLFIKQRYKIAEGFRENL